jgi:hypothetical protein
VDIFTHDLSYYYGPHSEFGDYKNQKRNALFIIQQCAIIASENGDTEVQEKATESLQRYNALFQSGN